MSNNNKQALQFYDVLTKENAKELLNIDDYGLPDIYDIRIEKSESPAWLSFLVVIQFDARRHVDHEDLEAFADDNDLQIRFHEAIENEGRYQVTLERNIRRK